MKHSIKITQCGISSFKGLAGDIEVYGEFHACYQGSGDHIEVSDLVLYGISLNQLDEQELIASIQDKFPYEEYCQMISEKAADAAYDAWIDYKSEQEA
jgi:hypothetical protein